MCMCACVRVCMYTCVRMYVRVCVGECIRSFMKRFDHILPMKLKAYQVVTIASHCVYLHDKINPD